MGVVSTAVDFMRATANDNSHGYDQANRWGPDYDCSSLVITAYKKAGLPLSCTYTGNMYSDMLANGFKDITASVNLFSGAGLKAGDVLLNVRSHTAMFIGNGQIAQASGNEFGGVTGGVPGDQTGGEINIRSYYNFPWDYVLRYTENTPVQHSTTTHQTETIPVQPSSDSGIQNGIYTVKSGDTMWGLAERFYGNGTEYARIMRDNGLTTSNLWVGQKLKIGEQPTASEVEESAPEQMCTVRLPIVGYGDAGMKVRKIQSLLIACGYSITVDGDFGTATKNAIIYLQKAKGLPETGTVDGRTYEALMS